jgi:hypothetical protein
MAKNTKNNGRSKREMRSMRIQQAVFIMIGLIVIFSMVISMLIK